MKNLKKSRVDFLYSNVSFVDITDEDDLGRLPKKPRKTFVDYFEKFCEDSKRLFGDKFKHNIDDYSNTRKIRVVCPVHGERFMKKSHFLGLAEGCFECHKVVRAFTRFIALKEATERNFKDRYTSIFNPARFPQQITFKDNLTGKKETVFTSGFKARLGREVKLGQPSSYKEKLSEILKRATEIHGGKYTYKNTVDTPFNAPSSRVLTVTCQKHGDSDISVHYHLKGTGCPGCLTEMRKSSMSNRTSIPVVNKVTGVQYKNFKECMEVLKISSYHLRDFFRDGILPDNPEKAEKIKNLEICR